VEVVKSAKHSSLLQNVINYSFEKFYVFVNARETISHTHLVRMFQTSGAFF